MLAGQLAFQHQCAFAGGGVDAVEVRCRALVVGDMGAHIAAHRPAPVEGDLHLTHRRIRERDVATIGDVEGLTEREVPVQLRADHLDRLDPVVVGAPHIDVGDGVGAAPPGCVGRRGLGDDAEEDPPAILAEGEWGPLADDEALRKAIGFGRFQANRRDFGVVDESPQVGQREEDIVAFAHLLDRASLQDRQAVAIVTPGEPAVEQRVIVEDVGAAASQVQQEQSVSVADLCVHRVGEEVSLSIEGDVTDRAQKERAA